MEKSREAFRTISEVSEILDTPPHVLRFWESRFPQVRPVKRAGGRRYYRPTDVALLSGIKRLLHSDGLTIRGVQKVLREQGIRHVMALADDALMGEVIAEQGMPAIDPDIAPPIARVLPFPDAAAPRVAPAPAMPPDPDLNAIPEMAVEPADLVDDSAVQVIEELALPDEEQVVPADEPEQEVSLQLTELIAEFIEQAESEADETATAPELPLWANAPAASPPAPALPPASDPAPAPAAAELGDDAADAAEAPRGAWIATELRRLTPPMAAPYSAEFSALGRRLEALRAKAASTASQRKG